MDLVKFDMRGTYLPPSTELTDEVLVHVTRKTAGVHEGLEEEGLYYLSEGNYKGPFSNFVEAQIDRYGEELPPLVTEE